MMCMCVPVWEYMHMIAGVLKRQRCWRPESWSYRRLWLLEIRLRSSRTAGSTLEPPSFGSHPSNLLFFFFKVKYHTMRMSSGRAEREFKFSKNLVSEMSLAFIGITVS